MCIRDSQSSVTVEAGDTLTELADAYLGDPLAYLSLIHIYEPTRPY